MMAQKLSELVVQRRKFDPANKLDRKIAYEFLDKKKWCGIESLTSCPFHCEWPYLDIPSLLRDKLVKYYSAR